MTTDDIKPPSEPAKAQTCIAPGSGEQLVPTEAKWSGVKTFARGGLYTSQALLYGATVFCVTFVLSLIVVEARGRPLPPINTYPLVMETAEPPIVSVSSVVPRFSIYFNNGSHSLSALDSARLKAFVSALASCGEPVLRLKGWVSSAPFANENSIKNLRLANRRVESVVAAIDDIVPRERLLFEPWSEYETLMLSRHYVDDRLVPGKPNGAEFLNRRVDVDVDPSTTDCVLSSEEISELLFLGEMG